MRCLTTDINCVKIGLILKCISFYIGKLIPIGERHVLRVICYKICIQCMYIAYKPITRFGNCKDMVWAWSLSVFFLDVSKRAHLGPEIIKSIYITAVCSRDASHSLSLCRLQQPYTRHPGGRGGGGGDSYPS